MIGSEDSLVGSGRFTVSSVGVELRIFQSGSGYSIEVSKGSGLGRTYMVLSYVRLIACICQISASILQIRHKSSRSSNSKSLQRLHSCSLKLVGLYFF